MTFLTKKLRNTLIKVLNENVLYIYNLKEVRLDNTILYLLNAKVYDNENNNSSVINTVFDNKKIFFIRDSGVELEKN
jgi:hypothetical protein